MLPSRSASYRSYLIRCWFAPADGSAPRFVVETVSGPPQHWGFESFAELVVFLETELQPLHTTVAKLLNPEDSEQA
ncbi:MAG: hypothetical protein HC822_12805 [Oscillochloris sp.]|nr:hypothetical protein [Oscillochloris sp.]